jgi:hypothetical protein
MTPMTLQPPQLIRASIASRYTRYLKPLSLRSVERMCRDGVFPSAQKLGHGPNAHWFISEVDIFKHKVKQHSSQLCQ